MSPIQFINTIRNLDKKINPACLFFTGLESKHQKGLLQLLDWSTLRLYDRYIPIKSLGNKKYTFYNIDFECINNHFLICDPNIINVYILCFFSDVFDFDITFLYIPFVCSIQHNYHQSLKITHNNKLPYSIEIKIIPPNYFSDDDSIDINEQKIEEYKQRLQTIRQGYLIEKIWKINVKNYQSNLKKIIENTYDKTKQMYEKPIEMESLQNWVIVEVLKIFFVYQSIIAATVITKNIDTHHYSGCLLPLITITNGNLLTSFLHSINKYFHSNNCNYLPMDCFFIKNNNKYYLYGIDVLPKNETNNKIEYSDFANNNYTLPNLFKQNTMKTCDLYNIIDFDKNNDLCLQFENVKLSLFSLLGNFQDNYNFANLKMTLKQIIPKKHYKTMQKLIECEEWIAEAYYQLNKCKDWRKLYF